MSRNEYKTPLVAFAIVAGRFGLYAIVPGLAQNMTGGNMPIQPLENEKHDCMWLIDIPYFSFFLK